MTDKEGENEIAIFFFLREIRQIRFGYLIHGGMMDEEEFYFCLACGLEMRFW